MMNRSQVFFRSGLLAVAIVFLVPCASAWSFGGWSGPADKATLQPGTPVSAGCSLSFSSFETGSTFTKDNSLTMYTDLSDPAWVVTMVEPRDEDTPLTSTLASRKSAQVRIDSYYLHFSRKQFTVNIKLTGKVPLLNQTQEIIVMRVQEVDPSATVLKGTVNKRVAEVVVPTTEPTPVPAVTTEETVLVITPEPVATPSSLEIPEPSIRQTYAPGPDPVTICCLLAGMVAAAGIFRRRQ